MREKKKGVGNPEMHACRLAGVLASQIAQDHVRGGRIGAILDSDVEFRERFLECLLADEDSLAGGVGNVFSPHHHHNRTPQYNHHNNINSAPSHRSLRIAASGV
jgi:hypothetical protein